MGGRPISAECDRGPCADHALQARLGWSCLGHCGFPTCGNHWPAVDVQLQRPGEPLVVSDVRLTVSANNTMHPAANAYLTRFADVNVHIAMRVIKCSDDCQPISLTSHGKTCLVDTCLLVYVCSMSVVQSSRILLYTSTCNDTLRCVMVCVHTHVCRQRSSTTQAIFCFCNRHEHSLWSAGQAKDRSAIAESTARTVQHIWARQSYLHLQEPVLYDAPG